MPRNRRAQDRQEKRSEIVLAAERLLVEVGYDHTSIGQIAADAGVTPNTIYWYFDDKDDLLVAVLENVLANALDEFPTIDETELSERMLWVVQRLERLHELVTVVHSRTAASSRINDWHKGFYQLIESILAEGLRQVGLPSRISPP